MGLETVEILLSVEEHFRISVPDASWTECVTVADLQNLVVELLVAQGRVRSEFLRREVWDGILTVLRQEGYDVARIRPDSTWVGDITKYG